MNIKTFKTLTPKNITELETMVKAKIDKNGYKCSLNHIDVSKITDMSYLFFQSKFNGDISKWDVSNVQIMSGMFSNSEFNGDISKWDVSKVEDMQSLFNGSKFNGDISNWDVSNLGTSIMMFYNSSFNGDLNNWKPLSLHSNDQCFDGSVLEKEDNLPYWAKMELEDLPQAVQSYHLHKMLRKNFHKKIHLILN